MAADVLRRLGTRARRLRDEVTALAFAVRHSATPWYAKLFVAAVVAYALSPIDLIPDFIPVLGYVDDLLLLPLGIALALRMIPATVMDECRARARDVGSAGRHASRTAGMVVVLVWLTCAALVAVWAYRAFFD